MRQENKYLELLAEVANKGVSLPDRTGTGRKTIFGRQLRFSHLNDEFPILTTKKIYWKGVVGELLWFLRGDTNIKYLRGNNIHIWDAWADNRGNLGPVYGAQWRGWSYGNLVAIDQLTNVIESLRDNPYSRRHIISTWNPAEITEMALPPCHGLTIQFFTDGERLSCSMYQRSADIFLGVPFNISSYALLTHIIAKQVDLIPHELIMSFGDVHLYDNHVKQAEMQLLRAPIKPPQLADFPVKELGCMDNMKYEISDFKLIDYQHHMPIKAPVAV